MKNEMIKLVKYYIGFVVSVIGSSVLGGMSALVGEKAKEVYPIINKTINKSVFLNYFYPQFATDEGLFTACGIPIKGFLASCTEIKPVLRTRPTIEAWVFSSVSHIITRTS